MPSVKTELHTAHHHLVTIFAGPNGRNVLVYPAFKFYSISVKFNAPLHNCTAIRNHTLG